MKGWIKSQTSDNDLFPLRMQLTELIPRDSYLLELGRGTGDLLFLTSGKIRYGMGLEDSGTLVRFARRRMKSEGIRNVAIRKARFPRSIQSVAPVDCGVASIFFSGLPPGKAESTLRIFGATCAEVLIADFVSGRGGRPSLTQVLSGRDMPVNREYFRSFARSGYVEGMIDRTGLEIVDAYDTFSEAIRIYRIAGTSGLSDLRVEEYSTAISI
jgi:hypothetical protein